jgi:CP family cyanate transporter-like MFS transporter
VTRPAGRAELAWLVALVAVAVNLRPAIASVPPLVDQLSTVYGLTSLWAGALTTLPVVCMGVYAPLAAFGAARAGERAVLLAALSLIAAGAGLRAVGPLWTLYAGTVLAGTGIAVAGALLPALVRGHSPARVGPVTGLYTAFLIGGALLASGVTEPLRTLFGGSPTAVLAVWAVPAVVALAVCGLVPGIGRSSSSRSSVRRGPGRRSRRPEVRTGSPSTSDSAPPEAGRAVTPWRSRAAWLGALFMGAQSLLFYSTLAWLAPRYTELGFSAGAAGALLALFSAAQIVTAFGLPWLAQRIGAVAATGLSVGATCLGLLLVTLAPGSSTVDARPWLWAVLLGLGMGGNLALALTVIARTAPSPDRAAAYAGMALSVGYLLAAGGPVAAGALRDATGGLTAVFAGLSALGLVTLALGPAAARSVAPGPVRRGQEPSR